MATRYVDTAAAAGGNGTTNGLFGTNRAYSSLAAWEAARQAVLTDVEEVICSASTGIADTTQCVIDGWTTTSSFYIDIKTDPAYRHAGVWNTAKYRLARTGTGANLRIVESFTRVTGLQNEITVTTAAFFAAYQIDADSCILDRCIAKGVLSGGAVGSGDGYGFIVDSGSNIIRNCLAYDFNGGLNHGFTSYSTGTQTWQNNTTHNCYLGFRRMGGTVNATNCGAASNGAGGFSGTITQTTCSSTNPTFVNEAGDNFHLASGDTTWRNVGTDLTGSFTTDIDGQTRTGTWDIGADEYVAVTFEDIQFDTASNGANGGGATITWNHTCSGSNRLLLVGVASGGSGGDFCSGVTYNGVAMTLVLKVPNGSIYTYLFALLNPASGTNAVVVSQSMSVSMYGMSMSYTGVNQTSQPHASHSNTAGSAANLTDTVTTLTDRSWTAMVAWSFGSTISAGTGSRQRATSSFNFVGLFDSDGPITPAGSKSMQAVSGISNDTISMVIAAFAPVGGSGGTASGTGASTGAATVTGISKAIARSVGTSTGVSTNTGVSKAQVKSTGASAGVSTNTGIGKSQWKSVGSSVAGSTNNGIGKAGFRATGTSAGVAVGTGVSRAIKKATGVSTGVASVTSVARSTYRSTGTSTGTATTLGTGRTQTRGTGSSAGVASVTSVARSRARANGSSSGSSLVNGLTTSGGLRYATGTAAGIATILGVGKAQFRAVGAAAGSSAGIGAARSAMRAVGSSAGFSTVPGVSKALARSIGASFGTSTVIGVSTLPNFIDGPVSLMFTVPFQSRVLQVPYMSRVFEVDDAGDD